ncbi:hypothetical protein YC2023_020911 [Brassica napus]
MFGTFVIFISLENSDFVMLHPKLTSDDGQRGLESLLSMTWVVQMNQPEERSIIIISDDLVTSLYIRTIEEEENSLKNLKRGGRQRHGRLADKIELALEVSRCRWVRSHVKTIGTSMILDSFGPFSTRSSVAKNYFANNSIDIYIYIYIYIYILVLEV